MSHTSPKAFGYPTLIEVRRRWFPCVVVMKRVGGGTILRGSKLSTTRIWDLPFLSGKTTQEKVRGRCF
ncbi:hypothetical protein Hanom_Chr01g00039971 [Helianthus anomalus]